MAIELRISVKPHNDSGGGPQMLRFKLAIGSPPWLDLGDEVVLELAEEAILEGTFNDPKWLD